MMIRKKISWIIGTVMAFGGVAIARIGAHHIPPELRPTAAIVGIIIAFGGLLVIALGTRK